MSRPDRVAALRELFRQECDRLLTRMAGSALRLDDGADHELLDELFRDAHTVKGSGAVLGFDDVAALAHVLEDLLQELVDGSRPTSGEVVDALLGAVDDLRVVIAATLGDQPTAALSEQGVARLRATLAGAPAVPAVAAVPAPVEHAAPRAAAAPGPAALVVRVDRLDEMTRLAGECATSQLQLGRVLAEAGTDLSSLPEFVALSRSLGELRQATMRARTVPVSSVVELLQRAVREVARAQGKQVRWEVRGEDTELDRDVMERLSSALVHAVRNAVDHGIGTPEQRRAEGKPEEGFVRLHAMQLGGEVVLVVTDDGRGIDVPRLRAQAGEEAREGEPEADDAYVVFRTGLSTAESVTALSGRGVGMDVVRQRVEEVRGRIDLRTGPGGTELRLVVPITLAVLPSLVVTAGGQRFAVPQHSVVTVLPGSTPVRSAEGAPTVRLADGAVRCVGLSGVLGLPAGDPSGALLVLTGLTRRLAVRVDSLVGRWDVAVKQLSPLLGPLPGFTGAAVEPDGSVLLVLDAEGLIGQARAASAPVAPGPAAPTEARSHGEVLVVDDALTIRELQRSILERAGYSVRTAMDGQEALALLMQRPADLVLTDIEMPVMDGLALTAAIRGHERLASTAVLVLTSRGSDEDRRRGLEAGADGYLVKSGFDEATLLEAVRRLLGSPS